MTGRRPRRILMTGDCVGGVWTYALDLAAGLAAYDVEVTLFVSGAALTPAKSRAAGRLGNLTLVGSDLKLEWMEDPEEDLATTDRLLLELEDAVRPDVVHINGYAAAAAGFAAPVLAVAHSCVETWWRAVKGEPAPAEWDRYRARIRAGTAAARCLVAPTRAHLKAFAAAHGRPGAGRVIHNGCDTERHAADRKTDRVLAAGRIWDEAKNLAVLGDVARRGVPIALAGDAGCATVGGDGLTHLGALEADAMAAQMATSSVFVAPALYEPFGLAVLEAALSECALVVGDIPTMRELWDGVAFFVPPRDPDAIAATLRHLLTDRNGTREAGAAARARALRNSRDAMAQQYLHLYSEVMASGGATTRARAA